MGLPNQTGGVAMAPLASSSSATQAGASAASLPAHQQVINKLVSDLRSRDNDARNRAARELHGYVSSELREVPQEELNTFLDGFTRRILDLVQSPESASKMGGVMAIVALINADVCNTNDRISRFGNYLRINCLPPQATSVAVIELAARAIARLTQVSGAFTANVKFELIDHEVKRAFEMLSGERNEGKQYAAVLILREIAFSMPTFFFQNVSRFFEVVFFAVWDPKATLREAAVNALRAALVVTAQRETSKQQHIRHQQHTGQWYTRCCDQSFDALRNPDGIPTGTGGGQRQDKKVTREDRVHGAILVLTELMRSSNSEWERANRDIEENILNEENMGGIGGTGSFNSTRKQEKGSLGAVRRYYQAAGFGGGGGGGRSSSFSASTSAATGSMVSVSSQIPFSWYGTVMVGREPIVESAQCKKILLDRYDELCKLVLHYSTLPWCAKSTTVTSALLGALPRMAALNRSRFAEKFLHQTVMYTDRLLQDRSREAFVATGLLAVAVGGEIQPYLSNILVHIRLSLPSKEHPNRKRTSKLDPAIFACVSMLARAARGTIRNELGDMLESMLGVGLSPALTTALHELAWHVPAFRGEIAEGLLKILSLILMRRPYLHPGTPAKLRTQAGAQAAQALAATGGAAASSAAPSAAAMEPPETSAIVLALRTLGGFDFEGHSLLLFVRHCADHYLHSEEKPIRLEAVKTCASLLKGALAALGNRHSPTVMSTINDVLAKLLIVGITDQDSDVRWCVLDSFDECFDYHLAQAENLSTLFVSLNDEVFEIREQTICLIGRLAILNPAYVTPSLRKTLIELLTEMEHSGIGRNKEQSAKMLGHLVANAPTLICPYVEPIMKVLVPKLREAETSPMVVTSVLRAVGDLAMVSGNLMQVYVPELLPLLLDILADSSSSQKREVSLWTLAQLVEATGCVTEPYARYPQLLDTLLGFLRTEQRGTIRAQTLRLLGLLGALDPYRHKLNTGQVDSDTSSAGVTSVPLIPIAGTAENGGAGHLEQSWEMSPSELLVNMGSGCLDEFYPSVAIATLMRIVRDPMLSQHHTEVVQAVTYIFRALGIKSVPYIPQVIPSMINVIRMSDVKFHDNLFRQLGILVGIVRQHIRNYLPNIFALIREFWSVESPLQPTIIGLAENISDALGSEFKVYLPNLIPQMLRVLSYDSSSGREVTLILLGALKKFGATLSDYMHLLLPKVVVFFDSPSVPMPVRRLSLECVDHLSDHLDLSEYASLLIHPLARCLDKCPELRTQAMETLAAIVAQLGRKYIIFVPMVQKVLIRHKINHQRYDILCARITEGGGGAAAFGVDGESSYLSRHSRSRRRPGSSNQGDEQQPPQPPLAADLQQVRRLPKSANIANLQEAWAVSRRVSKDDWADWYGRLCSELLKASPSPALRACWTVAQRHAQLARDLFNASFVSCWTELDASQQDELMAALESALVVPDLPEISQTVLNLAEFMEHCDRGPLPIDPKVLGEQAIRCRAYAKALHYKEDEFHEKPSVPVLEALISINNKLGQKEAAAGLLEWGRKNLPRDLKVQERWYEKLHDWEKALQAYREKPDQDDPEVLLGRMRCHEALGEWGDLHEAAEAHWPTASKDTKHRMAKMAASAAWGRREWEAMARYTQLLPRESQDGAFYRAVLHVHHERWSEAQELIDLTRSLLDTEVTALSLESYQRVYPTMVAVQMLAELEEVVEYRLVPERQSAVRKMWWDRLQGCQRAVEDWQRLMHVRSLVINPQTDQRTWLKYASLCRKSGRLPLSHRTLISILGEDPSGSLDMPLPTTHPQATFAYCKHLWAADQKTVAFNQLHCLVKRFVQPRTVHLEQEAGNAAAAQGGKVDPRQAERIREMKHLLARCYHKLGQWQESLQGISEKSIGHIRDYYQLATENDSVWYKAWHSWAVVNFEAVLFYKHQQQQLSLDQGAATGSSSSKKQQLQQPANFVSNFAVPALKGFVRSIALSKGSSLQDTLRLLTLLFDYGHQPDMYEALHEGLRTVEIDNWLQVIPQLIARIDTPRPLVSRLIHQVLTDLGKSHPQAIIYSLTVAAKSTTPARRTAANKILDKIREHDNLLVGQALMVSDELIRVAILWHEQWHEGLEEASRLYFGERNVPGMLAVLRPLHAMLERGPQTLKETSFQQAYGNDLSEAKKWCERYETSGSSRDLNQAWDLYYHVFRRISRQLPKLTQLELHYVSPKLLACRDLELAVPGSYVPGRENICIAQVQPSLVVITSKQRPRKLSMRGSNGRSYMFLLKGHEDLRQDERVMQFFSLVNSLLLSDPETFRRNLAIQRFAVIPLSTNSGLIGWVPHSDTLHGLIKDYRDKKKIVLNIEHRIMQRMAPNSDHLPLMNKVEVFEHSLEHTKGDDLAKILLLKAPSSEVWFDRRTNFTRSLAVMSMVGYVLGLGDRHPSNLLLDRMSGKILHIDFGDCFEVAMTREKFPEKIPFRLTRMLINAMEVTGIEGTYRSTCESVMRVLRLNKDSLMAVLEAFVYDPLLNWRLIETGPKAKKSKAAATAAAAVMGGDGVVAGGTLTSTAGDLDSLAGDATMSSTLPNTSKDGAAVTASRGDISSDSEQPELLNKKALDIIHRVRDKLTGRDFSHEEQPLDVPEQVDRLIEQATNNENLCQSYIGWCPFW